MPTFSSFNSLGSSIDNTELEAGSVGVNNIIGDVVASDTEQAANNTQTNVPAGVGVMTFIKAITLSDTPALSSIPVRVKYNKTFSTGNPAYTNVFINGVAAGTQRSDSSGNITYTEDFVVNSGDEIAIYGYAPNGSYNGKINAFSLSMDFNIAISSEYTNS